MYKYSKGINLVAGGEKHRVYVKKSPTGVGKGVKGHVMVNHPTTDKGKWDTIDLTEKAGAKTVEDGKNATKKWHAENPYMYGTKSVKQYRGDENLPEAKNGMKKCGCKHPNKKYKYGTGALTIPEGSAIVTANGGKNMQALQAYEEGDFPRLNKIINKMPEDRGDKAKNGIKNTYKKYKFKPGTKNVSVGSNVPPTRNPITGEIGTVGPTAVQGSNQGTTQQNTPVVPTNTNPVAPKETWTGTGKTYAYKAKTKGKLDFQPDRFNEETWSEQNYPAWMQTVAEGLKDPARADKIIDYLKNYEGQDYEDVRKIVNTPGLNKQQLLEKIEKLSTDTKVGPFHVAVQEGLKQTEGEKPKEEPVKTFTEEGEKKTEIIPPPPGITPTPPQKKNFMAPSLAEILARGSILRQGVEGVPENYLKLDRYNYASQLPKTLREIQLAEQAGRESARDIVAGDTGRYLSQSGNLSAARMKAANDAVVQDTLARQDILNKNVDLSNTELTTNTELKNAYAMQRAANRGAYNNQLISLGQSIDTAADTAKLMSAQKDIDDLKAQLLQTKNYMMNPNATITVKTAKKGLKKVKNYKRR